MCHLSPLDKQRCVVCWLLPRKSTTAPLKLLQPSVRGYPRQRSEGLNPLTGLTPCGVGLLLLGEQSPLPSLREQCWNKTLHLFTMLSPCLRSVLLIVQSLQLIKSIVKFLLEKKLLHMGSSYFPRWKGLIVFNILLSCSPEQKSLFRIYRKKLMQDLLVFKSHHLLLVIICVFSCILKEGRKFFTSLSTLAWGPADQVSSGAEFFYKWVIIKPWK